VQIRDEAAASGGGVQLRRRSSRVRDGRFSCLKAWRLHVID